MGNLIADAVFALIIADETHSFWLGVVAFAALRRLTVIREAVSEKWPSPAPSKTPTPSKAK